MSNQYVETLKQSMNNYLLPVLEEIMAEDHDQDVLIAIIKSRLIMECAKDQRIEQVLNIVIEEGDEAINIPIFEVKPVNSESVEII